MKIYLVKKEKGRVYKSEEIVRALFGMELEHDEDGAPRLGCAEAPRPAAGPLLPRQQAARHISVTDTRNYWACALSEAPVGIDMEERSRAVKPDVVKRFHKEEQEYLAALSEGSREWTEEFLSIWTRKEAYSKMLGKGLRLGFSRFSVLSDLPARTSEPAADLPARSAENTVSLASFTYKDIVFGTAEADWTSQGTAAASASGKPAEIVPVAYDAPMEMSALDYAAGLLDVRAYTSAALMEKLTGRGYRREESEEAIRKLKGYGYINDEAFAEQLARRAAESGKGSRRISFELKEKGIDKELASQTASEYRESDYDRAFAAAKKLLGKTDLSQLQSKDLADDLDADTDDLSAEDLTREQKKELFAERRRLAGKVSRKLSSLGYDASVICSVLEDLGL